MSSGYSPRCKTCNSKNRIKIEEWHGKEGLSSRAIQAKLKSEYNEEISSVAIDNHFNEHYNVQAEVQEQYYRSQANLQAVAGERVSEIQMLDDVALEKYRLHQKLTKILGNRIKGLEDLKVLEDLPKLPVAYVTLYTGCAAEMRQCLKTKQELLGEDGETKKAKALQSWVDLMAEE